MSKLWCCVTPNKNDDYKINARFKENGKVKDSDYQLLLLGTDESGKSAIIEKLVALQNQNQFTLKNKTDMIPGIKRHIRDSFTNILRNLNTIVPSMQLEYPQNQWRARYILTTAHQVDFDYPSEFYEHVSILWADAGVQSCFEKCKEYQLNDSAKYFLDCVDRVKQIDYIPSNQDMICCRFLTSIIYEMIFNMESIRFKLFEVDLLRNERRKWIHYFSDVMAIIFVTDCSSFDLMPIEDGYRTRLDESLHKFKSIRINEWLRTKSVILFLNKQDRLAKKIQKGVRLEHYFPEVTNDVVLSHESGLLCLGDKVDSVEDLEVTRAKHFIRNLFLQVNIVVGESNQYCYSHFTCDNDPETTRWIFNDCRRIIQRQHLQQSRLL